MATATDKVYQYVTERILNQLKKGVIPWRETWMKTGRPMNLVSGKYYRGINVWLLGSMPYTSPYWLTYNQCKGRGGQVRKGEKSSMIVKVDAGERTKNGVAIRDKDGKTQKFFSMRYFNVFNVEQCDNLEYPKPEAKEPIDKIEACEAVIGGFLDCPPITHEGDRAFYRSSDDSITMPPLDTFVGAAEYYSVLFHEAIHSTGHKSRLGRDLENRDRGSYAREELVAEMGAAFLCNITGIECKTIDNSAAYIQSWLKALSNDPKMVVKAATKAQAAAEYIQGIEAPKYDDKSDSKVAPAESDNAMALAAAEMKAEYAGIGGSR